ncbi:hypothetical protein R1sor_026252 [Riccia sorocarpa]|uniref:GDSL esterase/lipase n=1 Tax=Riccia sorocarpa TaxID=122646 RepID=A0ABD3GCX1_9MARC
MGKSLKSCLRFLLVLNILIHGWNHAFVSAQSTPFPAVVFIGASQSDVGVNNNVPNSLARANFLPYGRDFVNGNQTGPTGRFSNGKILPDFVAQNISLPFPPPYNSPSARGAAVLQGINTASAGSGWLNGTNSNLGVVPGTQQVQWVRNWQQSLVGLVGTSRASRIVREALYGINTSDNDLLAYYGSTTLQQQYTEDEYIKLILDTAVPNIRNLYSGGARRFAVTSVSARGCAPNEITRYQPTMRDQCVQGLQDLVQKYNTAYKATIQSLQSSLQGSKFYFADTFTITVDLFFNPGKYGLRHDTSIACCGTGTFEVGPTCNSLSVGTCTSAADYLFFDSEHYTQAAWSIIVGTFIADLIRSLM